MPDPESKKNQSKKGKNDPKEQRKPRQQRHQGAGERRSEKRAEEPKVAPPERPVHEEPGPEFYKGLKRETEDILRISEEANSKYKKKEIQSNWAKYEVPIESYDEVEEQENLGADYEKLIEAPQSGGHFQFKHEKSWDINTGPSQYDSYFDINKNDLPTALFTIPFYERNGIDKDMFSETDIQTMDQRTSMYKHKYFKITTVESELQNKLIASLKDDYSKIKIDVNRDERTSESEKDNNYEDDICFDESKLNQTKAVSKDSKEPQEEFIFKRADELRIEPIVNDDNKSKENEVIDNIDDIIAPNENMVRDPEVMKVAPVPEAEIFNKTTPKSTEPEKKPVIESPEDLEKWLDDFLDE